MRTRSTWNRTILTIMHVYMQAVHMYSVPGNSNGKIIIWYNKWLTNIATGSWYKDHANFFHFTRASHCFAKLINYNLTSFFFLLFVSFSLDVIKHHASVTGVRILFNLHKFIVVEKKTYPCIHNLRGNTLIEWPRNGWECILHDCECDYISSHSVYVALFYSTTFAVLCIVLLSVQCNQVYLISCLRSNFIDSHHPWLWIKAEMILIWEHKVRILCISWPLNCLMLP